MASKTYTSNGITVTCKVDLKEGEESISKSPNVSGVFNSISVPEIKVFVRWDTVRYPTAAYWGFTDQTVSLYAYTDVNQTKTLVYQKNTISGSALRNNDEEYVFVSSDSTSKWGGLLASRVYNGDNSTTRIGKIKYCDFLRGRVVALYDSKRNIITQITCFPSSSYSTVDYVTQRIELLDSVFTRPYDLVAEELTYTDNRHIAGHVSVIARMRNAKFRYGATLKQLNLTIGSVGQRYTGSVITHQFNMPLNNSGVLKGVIQVVDTRGFVEEISLGNIVVNPYVKPRISNAQIVRTNVNGKDSDEGTYVVFSAIYTAGGSGLKSKPPLYRVLDQDGNDIQELGTWYKHKDSNGVNTKILNSEWESYSGTFYCLIEVLDGEFIPEKSYTVIIVPLDEFNGQGNEMSITVPPAFFTVDFLAGGHGIAFGKLSTREGFDCDMDTYFKDMSSQEILAFINNLSIFLN